MKLKTDSEYKASTDLGHISFLALTWDSLFSVANQESFLSFLVLGFYLTLLIVIDDWVISPQLNSVYNSTQS
jgi:hypothetical protein